MCLPRAPHARVRVGLGTPTLRARGARAERVPCREARDNIAALGVIAPARRRIRARAVGRGVDGRRVARNVRADELKAVAVGQRAHPLLRAARVEMGRAGGARTCSQRPRRCGVRRALPRSGCAHSSSRSIRSRTKPGDEPAGPSAPGGLLTGDISQQSAPLRRGAGAGPVTRKRSIGSHGILFCDIALKVTTHSRETML